MLLCSVTKKKTGSAFPPFCHATFHHALITSVMYPKRGTIAQMYHSQESTGGIPCLVE